MYKQVSILIVSFLILFIIVSLAHYAESFDLKTDNTIVGGTISGNEVVTGSLTANSLVANNAITVGNGLKVKGNADGSAIELGSDQSKGSWLNGSISYRSGWDPQSLNIVGTDNSIGQRRRVHMWDDVHVDHTLNTQYLNVTGNQTVNGTSVTGPQTVNGDLVVTGKIIIGTGNSKWTINPSMRGDWLNFYKEGNGPHPNNHGRIIMQGDGNIWQEVGGGWGSELNNRVNESARAAEAARAAAQSDANTIRHIFSDRRIKKNIVPLDSSLVLLRKMKPVRYQWKDCLKEVYGFIAQDVKEYLPTAVTTQKKVIHNIFQEATCEGSTLTFSDFDTSELSFDKDNKLFPLHIDGVEVNILEILDETRIRLDTVLSPKVFVIGQEVDDLHSIDNAQIFTVTTCAVQELDRKVQQLEEENKVLQRLEEENKVLQQQVTELFGLLKNLST